MAGYWAVRRLLADRRPMICWSGPGLSGGSARPRPAA